MADSDTRSKISRALAPDGPLGGGNLRAAVMGVNDGLVSNFSLVMGVAGGLDNPTIVMLAGIAGLLAGGFSMAAGEYISVASQRDVYLHQTRGTRRDEAGGADAGDPADGEGRRDADADLSYLGSPWGAAFSSFAAFVLGAFIPLAPYLLNLDGLSLFLSAALSAAALLAVGGAVAVGSGRGVAWGAMRMLLVGCAAAAATFGVGFLIGRIAGPALI